MNRFKSLLTSNRQNKLSQLQNQWRAPHLLRGALVSIAFSFAAIFLIAPKTSEADQLRSNLERKVIDLSTTFQNQDWHTQTSKILVVAPAFQTIAPSIQVIDQVQALCSVRWLEEKWDQNAVFEIDFDPDLEDGYNGCKVEVRLETGDTAVLDIHYNLFE
jgi:hypothetical protein